MVPGPQSSSGPNVEHLTFGMRAAKHGTESTAKGEAGDAEIRGERGRRVVEAPCFYQPVCRQTGRPPPSYPKNLVSQCNTAPPQSLQLAVWALFGVVS